MKQCKISEDTPMSRSQSAMLGVNKSSHVISKSYSVAKDEGRSSKYSQNKNIMTPTIRIVYVYEPRIIKTDPQNFRSLVQKLTGKSIHKSKEKKRQTSPKSPSSVVVSTGVGTENLEDTSYTNSQMPVVERKSTNVSIDDCSGFAEGFTDTDMVVPGMLNDGLLHEIPLVRNNSPYCNMYGQTGIYRWT